MGKCWRPCSINTSKISGNRKLGLSKIKGFALFIELCSWWKKFYSNYQKIFYVLLMMKKIQFKIIIYHYKWIYIDHILVKYIYMKIKWKGWNILLIDLYDFIIFIFFHSKKIIDSKCWSFHKDTYYDERYLINSIVSK